MGDASHQCRAHSGESDREAQLRDPRPVYQQLPPRDMYARLTIGYAVFA